MTPFLHHARRAARLALAAALSASLAGCALWPFGKSDKPADSAAAVPAAAAPAQPVVGTAAAATPPAAVAPPTGPRTAKPIDRVIAVVNDEVITDRELAARVRVTEEQLRRQKIQPPPNDVMRRQVLERMIVERAQLQLARETGVRVDDLIVNAAVGRVAESNNMTVQQLRARLDQDGISFARFRDDLRDDIILNRLREREVDSKVQISDAELDNFIAQQTGVNADGQEFRLSQILLRLPENATTAQVEDTRKRAEDIAAQLKAGGEFPRLAASYSNAPDALSGGDLGWRSADRLPNLFVDAIRDLKTGEIAPVVRSPNGFHVLKLDGKRNAIEAQLGAGGPVQQTRARHILLRVSDLAPEPEVRRRLEEMKKRVEAGQADFGQLARLNSVDPSGTRGGDLGWLYSGDTVPEFEKAMNALQLNQISEPVQSPFGWHLIQVTERKTEQNSAERARLAARAALRERKADEAYQDWLRQLRDRTYVEFRSVDEAS